MRSILNLLSWYESSYLAITETFLTESGATVKWGNNQPDNNGGSENCGVLDTRLETKLADEVCSVTYDYICQISKHSYTVFKDVCWFLLLNNLPAYRQVLAVQVSCFAMSIN